MTRFLSLNRAGFLAASLIVGIATTLHAQTITTFDMPNSTSTQPSAINAAGQITGSYLDAAFKQHGFLRQAHGTLVSFDAPLTGERVHTVVTSINAAGQITGYVFSGDFFLDFGFLRHTDGTFIVFGDPESCFLPTGMDALEGKLTPLGVPIEWVEGIAPTGINNRGQIAGICGPDPPFNQSFLRQPDGTIIVFRVPVDGPTMVQALAINSRGQITGWYYDSPAGGRYRGFLREPDGTITAIDASNSGGTTPAAINPRGQITGYADQGFGFLRQPDGSMVIFHGPNSTSVQPTAINPEGLITGIYLDASSAYHGFLREKDGRISTLDVPNATNTYPTGINPRGQITGWYSDASGVHGFVRSQ